MKQTYRALTLVLVCAVPALAQAPPPPSIVTPDKSESRIGPLDFKDGAPSKSTVDKLYDHKFDEARHKLDEWERKWGETEETRSLRRQLDAMPPVLDLVTTGQRDRDAAVAGHADVGRGEGQAAVGQTDLVT